MEWTSDRVEILRQLWQQGQTASQIAAQLGGVTRNAVIGKAHRLGLSQKATPVVRPEPAPRPVAAAVASSVTGRGCLWPVGDPKQPDFHFCGQPSETGRPYCAEHCAVAYHRRSDAA
jgi:GcrA cell cycle regulator